MVNFNSAFAKKILTVCPTRGRPLLCKRMYDSFIETANFSNVLVFLVDDDDVCLKDYLEFFKDTAAVRFVRPRSTTTDFINFAYLTFPDFDYYHITNDDFIYRTPAWDDIFIQSLEGNPGISYGNDLAQRDRLCTAPFISGDVVRALGWLQMPKLRHLGGDCVWMDIGREINSLHYHPHVEIEHCHYQMNKGIKDDTYKHTNSSEMYEIDRQSYVEWTRTEKAQAIARIRLALRGMPA